MDGVEVEPPDASLIAPSIRRFKLELVLEITGFADAIPRF
jgi:hypothetical protein